MALRIVLGSILATLAVGLVLAALLHVWGGASWLVQWELAMGAAAAITGASILLGSVRGRRPGASIVPDGPAADGERGGRKSLR
ncbi:MAG: hypothetical protein M3Z65_01000 [Chloroflexota bacterium]|nr:hypothetical protein [Chloroflexota bacterium]